MAATSKTELLAVTAKEYERLRKNIDEIDAAQALIKEIMFG